MTYDIYSNDDAAYLAQGVQGDKLAETLASIDEDLYGSDKLTIYRSDRNGAVFSGCLGDAKHANL